MKQAVMCVCTAALVVAVIGCGRKEPRKTMSERLAEKITEKAMEASSGGKAKVNLSKGTMRVQSAEGTVEIASEGSAKVPEGFPKDVAVYKDARVQQTVKTDKMVSLILASKDSIEKIADFYSKDMQSQGWKQEFEMKSGENATYSFSKGERHANVAVGGSGDQERMITLAVESEK